MSAPLPRALFSSVLDGLEIDAGPPTMEILHRVYAAWCRRVPFDNVRKLIHVRSQNPGPLPGSTTEDFFQAWLQHGTGATCWAAAGALHSLLCTLGFQAERGIATMMVVPDLPPNHGTVIVTMDDARFLLDCAILHRDPLPLVLEEVTGVIHPAWGVRCTWRDDRAHVFWRPLHLVQGMECRIEHSGASAEDYQQRYERTRGWSPFNHELTLRTHRGEDVTGIGFGVAATLHGDGRISSAPIAGEARSKLLIEHLGLSEEIVAQLPDDMPTPPPPGSRTASAQGQS